MNNFHMPDLPEKRVKKQAKNTHVQPRKIDGKFDKKGPNILVRFGQVLDGSARQKVRTSIRKNKELDRKMGRPVIPGGPKKRKRKVKKIAPVQTNYRKNVVLKLFGL